MFPASSARPSADLRKVDEEKSDRKFGGCSFVQTPVRDIPANMRVTAKQIRYNGEVYRQRLDHIVNDKKLEGYRAK